MSLLLRKYQQQLAERPLRTFALQSGCILTLGDIIAQQFIEKKGLENHDIARSLRTTAYGLCIGGPVIGTWFGFVNRVVTIKSKVGAAFARLALDQIFFTPTILAMYMGCVSVLEGRNFAQIQNKFRNSYLDGLSTAYHFWPFANMFVFAVVPMQFRPLINSGFGVGWNTYLSYLNQQSLKQPNLEASDIPSAL
ncbi:uncharacterized protein BYT42DRAFT_584517 [Radiomyces spectabilis]|uniref:uncharacterized protein n=1 Tax=Radiomyces spectabilis TaxID=64574 RepID=UPI00221F7CAB|nr:uncharacterized protein BYT42DRAFT_584517 [Radiomyces spectabilis]KAI8369449.1 hypothetical protein BYT42DRAFT_584517 [Radiomyces spectabilis]